MKQRALAIARATPLYVLQQHLEAVPHLLFENNLLSILGGVREAKDAATSGFKWTNSCMFQAFRKPFPLGCTHLQLKLGGSTRVSRMLQLLK